LFLGSAAVAAELFSAASGLQAGFCPPVSKSYPEQSKKVRKGLCALKRSSQVFIQGVLQDKQLEFSRSIISGVEIKRCRNILHAYKSHIHNELSLGYIEAGSTHLAFNDRTIIYEASDGVIIPPLMTHRCAPDDIGHWAYVMLFVDPSYYSGIVNFSQAQKLTGHQTEKLIDFIEQLLLEKDPDALENILIDLLLEFGENKSVERAADNVDSAQLIHDYILDHVHDAVTLDTLQQISGLNKFSLIKNFKKLYLTTPAAYHLQSRVAEAKRQLSQGADVFEIFAALGFYDQSHFIREFKKMYGVTPGAYRDQLIS
jgi:AraC-like DNA-binding protein